MRLMIKLSTFLCVLIFIYAKCIAQDDPFGKRKVFEGGIALGANISPVDGDTYASYHKIGIEAGGLVYVYLNSLFGISMELLYAQNGARGGTVKESIYLGTYID